MNAVILKLFSTRHDILVSLKVNEIAWRLHHFSYTFKNKVTYTLNCKQEHPLKIKTI